MSDLHR